MMTSLKFVFLVFISQVLGCSTNDKSSNTSKDSIVTSNKVSPPREDSDSVSVLHQVQSVGNAETTTASSKLTYTIIPSEENTFGYDIYMEGKMMIHQPSIP